MPLSLSEAALWLHEEQAAGLLSLAGATPCIARVKLPNPAQGTHWMSSLHATSMSKGAARRAIAVIGECALPANSTASRS